MESFPTMGGDGAKGVGVGTRKFSGKCIKILPSPIISDLACLQPMRGWEQSAKTGVGCSKENPKAKGSLNYMEVGRSTM